jgi:hypothetical protein
MKDKPDEVMPLAFLGFRIPTYAFWPHCLSGLDLQRLQMHAMLWAGACIPDREEFHQHTWLPLGSPPDTGEMHFKWLFLRG